MISLGSKKQQTLKKIYLASTLLALCVVFLGAYVRLSNAGLGCPDWPGCYGKATPPSAEVALLHTSDSPLDAPRAWKEMTHRYVAGSLSLLVLAGLVVSIVFRLRGDFKRDIILPFFVLLIIVAQALLGMLTVTWKLHPFVVMSHLLGGFILASCLWWLTLREGMLGQYVVDENPRIKFKIILSIIVVFIQIALGGWMSSNYASLACPDFPTCQGQWFPVLHLGEAFDLWKEVGVNYEGGLLQNEARMTVHFVHRLWAVVVFFTILNLGLTFFKKSRGKPILKIVYVLIGLLFVQIGLGIANVVTGLPLLVAVFHNVCALIILMLLGTLLYLLREKAFVKLLARTSENSDAPPDLL